MVQIRSLLLSFLNNVRIPIVSICGSEVLLFLCKELLNIILVTYYIVFDHLASSCPICIGIALLSMFLFFYLELVFLEGLVLVLHKLSCSSLNPSLEFMHLFFYAKKNFEWKSVV